MIEKKDIICFSFSDWDKEMVSNRYHMLTRFAQNNRVFLFEQPISLEKYDRHRWPLLLKPIRKRGDMIIVSPIGTPTLALQENVYRYYLGKIYAHFTIINPIFWFYNYKLAFLIDEFTNALSCYHCTEDYPGVAKLNYSGKNELEYITNIERNLICKSDLTFSVSRYLAKRLKKYNSESYLTLNAVDYELYKSSQQSATRMFGSEPVLGYCGNLSPKVNFELLYRLIKKINRCQLVLVGPVSSDDKYIERLKKLKNVRFIDKIKLDEIPNYYREFDVCLIPYIQDSWFVKVAQPLKLFEYMASGKPIVSTKMDCLKNYRDVVYESDTIEGFIEKTKLALAEKSAEMKRRRINLAKTNTWDNRFAFINKKIKEKLDKQ